MSRFMPLVLLALLTVVAPALRADPGQTQIVYTVQVKANGPRHYHFTIEVRNPEQGALTFIIPHWAPGAYRQITTGSRRSRTPAWLQLAGFKAVDGAGKTRKVQAAGPRKWTVDAKGVRSDRRPP